MVFCGIDIGTTSTKGIVLDERGRVVDEATLPTPMASARTYWYEHFCRIMQLFAERGQFADRSVACSVTGQGGSFVLLDAQHQPVGNVCCWTELAEDTIVQDLADAFGQTEYYHVTGWPPHGWLAAAKLRQMVERKQVPEGACHMATVPDLVYAQFLGELLTDVTSAQITGLVDFQGRRWSPAILDWIEMDESWLPSIVPGLSVLAEDIESPWGNLTLVTGSHDQYAAMEAAGLERDTCVMLGTGTAWVLDGRTSGPVFDDARFLIHPGRDVRPDCYGLIVTLWQVGAGLDKLLRHSGLTQASLTELEAAFAGMSVPEGPVRVNLDAGEVEPSGDAATSVRRYMEWAGSTVAHALEVCGLKHSLERIVATGGAMASRFWPQTISSICGLTLEAVDCASFTAYGAALHARTALLGPDRSQRFPNTATIRTYTPQRSQEYREWYCRHQRPSLDWQCH
ncbi:MAG TPA: FGGY family carbohydrate kinase [Sedimentisphaerales bacterium]|jgi:xylulokinase|nr:FGGY family carbohydrate kinase [Sedimentisphaerales bacterium]